MAAPRTSSHQLCANFVLIVPEGTKSKLLVLLYYNIDDEPRCIKTASIMDENRVVMWPRVTPQEYSKHQIGKKYGKTLHTGRSSFLLQTIATNKYIGFK